MTKRITFLPILLLFSLWSYGQYCVPNFPLGCTDDHIDNFEIPAINFAHLGTGCSSGQYADYSGDPSLLIVLEAGNTYDWSTTSNYIYQHVKIWVDINGDQVFDEATEEIDYAQSGSVLTLTEGEISIPAIFPPGTYRMRIATRYSSAPIPCNTAGYGEAHDYTVQILPPPTCLMPSNLSTTGITTTSADITWAAGASETNWNISWGTPGYTPGDSNEINTGTTSGTPDFQITNLTPLTSYDVYVQADCGSDGLSVWEGPYTFKTASDCSLYTLSVTANHGYVCDEGTTILTATGGGAGDAIYWYDAPSGGNLVGAGNSFETPYITQTHHIGQQKLSMAEHFRVKLLPIQLLLQIPLQMPVDFYLQSPIP